MGITNTLDSPVAKEIINMIKNNKGGLGGFVGQLKDAGLTDQVASWVGKGANKPIEANQLSASLGSDMLGKIAGKLGVSPEAAASTLAKTLPDVIDKLTPNGKIDTGNVVSQGMSILKKLFR